MVTYSGLGHRLRTYAAIPLMAALAVGCGGGEPPKPTQEPQKPAVSKTLEQTAQQPRDLSKISDDQLLQWYRGELQAIKAARSSDPPSYDKLHLNLLAGSRLAVLLSKNLESSRVRREDGIFYHRGEEPYQRFADPELTIPVEEEHFIKPVSVSNPRTYTTYTTSDGAKAVEIGDEGSGLWAYFREFGSKPGPYATQRIRRELAKLNGVYAGLNIFTRKVKPSQTSAELENLLEKESEEVRRTIMNALGREGSPDLELIGPQLSPFELTYSNLQARRQELIRIRSELRSILRTN